MSAVRQRIQPRPGVAPPVKPELIELPAMKSRPAPKPNADGLLTIRSRNALLGMRDKRGQINVDGSLHITFKVPWEELGELILGITCGGDLIAEKELRCRGDIDCRKGTVRLNGDFQTGGSVHAINISAVGTFSAEGSVMCSRDFTSRGGTMHCGNFLIDGNARLLNESSDRYTHHQCRMARIKGNLEVVGGFWSNTTCEVDGYILSENAVPWTERRFRDDNRYILDGFKVNEALKVRGSVLVRGDLQCGELLCGWGTQKADSDERGTALLVGGRLHCIGRAVIYGDSVIHHLIWDNYDSPCFIGKKFMFQVEGSHGMVAAAHKVHFDSLVKRGATTLDLSSVESMFYENRLQRENQAPAPEWVSAARKDIEKRCRQTRRRSTGKVAA